MINIINEYGDDEWATPEKGNSMENIKVGIDAFNDLARSHDAHVKEGERLREEVKDLKLRIKELEEQNKNTQQYLDLLE